MDKNNLTAILRIPLLIPPCTELLLTNAPQAGLTAAWFAKLPRPRHVFIRPLRHVPPAPCPG